MQVRELSCPSCGAPVSVPARVDRVVCAFCGRVIVLEGLDRDASEVRVRTKPDKGWVRWLKSTLRLTAGCGLASFVFFFTAFCLFLAASPFAPEVTSGGSSKVDDFLLFVALLVGLFAFLFFMTPNAPLWAPVRKLFSSRSGKTRSAGSDQSDLITEESQMDRED